MNTVDRLNAQFSDDAHWRMLWDAGLRWVACGSEINPACFLSDGALILRRWKGRKYDRPVGGEAIGFALRPGMTVIEHGGVAWAPDTVYWLLVERVSGGGVVTDGGGRTAQPVVRGGDRACVGGLPNPALRVTPRQGTDGALWLYWHYNVRGQQAQPAGFRIYSDYGTGTLDPTPIASAPYIEDQALYFVRLAITEDWDGWQFLVLSETAAAVQGLAAVPDGSDLSAAYGLAAIDAVAIAHRQVAAPAAPDLSRCEKVLT